MNNTAISSAIEGYLQELRDVLHGQDPALIQDVLYDAAEHLWAAAEAESDPLAAWPRLRESYGSPQEIASYYCDLESKVNLALRGAPPVTPRKPWPVLNILRDAQAYRAMVYMLLALPLGLIYLAWIALVGMSSVASSLFIFGLPYLLFFLQSIPYFSLFEGRLVEMLLDQRMPRRPRYLRVDPQQPRWQRWLWQLGATLRQRRYWTSLLYLLLRFPLGFAYFFVVIVLAVMSLAVMISPIADPLLHAYNPEFTIEVDWYWFPIATPGGLLGFVLALYLAKWLGRGQALLARFLLLEPQARD